MLTDETLLELLLTVWNILNWWKKSTEQQRRRLKLKYRNLAINGQRYLAAEWKATAAGFIEVDSKSIPNNERQWRAKHLQ